MERKLSFEQRLQQLEDREAIKALIARYGLVMDDRDLALLPTLFTEDVRIFSRDGVMDVHGRDAAVSLFLGRFEVLGPSNHFTHDKIINFDSDPDRASCFPTQKCRERASRCWPLSVTRISIGERMASGALLSAFSTSFTMCPLSNI